VEISFVSAEDVPVPPNEVRFRSVSVEPYPDGRRVKLTIALTPFLKPPNLEIALFDAAGRAVSGATIVENTEPRLSLTLHLRGACPPGAYQARLSADYPEEGQVAETGVEFSLADEDSAKYAG
jgi:hypothetical protein